MLNPGLTDSTGQVGQQAWGIPLTRPPQCLDYIHALTHSVFYVGTGNSNPGPQWCITHSYECSDLYEVNLLVWIYFKTSHWDSSIALTIWHTFGLEDLTDLRNLEHLRFQKFVSSLLHEEGSKHVPCCRKHLWNIKSLTPCLNCVMCEEKHIAFLWHKTNAMCWAYINMVDKNRETTFQSEKTLMPLCQRGRLWFNSYLRIKAWKMSPRPCLMSV